MTPSNRSNMQAIQRGRHPLTRRPIGGCFAIGSARSRAAGRPGFSLDARPLPASLEAPESGLGDHLDLGDDVALLDAEFAYLNDLEAEAGFDELCDVEPLLFGSFPGHASAA